MNANHRVKTTSVPTKIITYSSFHACHALLHVASTFRLNRQQKWVKSCWLGTKAVRATCPSAEALCKSANIAISSSCDLDKALTEEIKLTNCRELSLVWATHGQNLPLFPFWIAHHSERDGILSAKVGQHETHFLALQLSPSSNNIVLKWQANSFDRRTHHRKHA